MGTLGAWPGESESLDGLGMISCVTALVLSARAVSLSVERERCVGSMGMSPELMLTNGLMLPQDCCLQSSTFLRSFPFDTWTGI